MTTDELRTRYKELKARADKAYKATEALRAALHEAEYWLLYDEIVS